MALHSVYGFGLLLATTLVHLACTTLVLRWLHEVKDHHWARQGPGKRSLVLAAVVLGMAAAAYVESALWAGFYVAVGALENFRDSLYFSLVTYTTLGYGDVTLDREWRTLAAFQSVNGIIMFGWTTALVVAVATRLATLARESRRS